MSCLLCDNPEYIRGLCYAHYKRAYKLIRKGETTWDNLVAMGQARAFIPDAMRKGHLIPRDTDIYVEKSEIALLYQDKETRTREIDRHISRVRLQYADMAYDNSSRRWVS